MAFKKSQLQRKNIGDLAINPEHLSPYAIQKVLDEKKVGVARIISRLIFEPESGFESGQEPESGIVIPFGSEKIEITSNINEAVYLAHATMVSSKNGVLLSGQGNIIDSLTTSLKSYKGQALYEGINQVDTIGTGTSGKVVWTGTTSKYPVKQESFKIYINSVLTAWDDGEGHIIGNVVAPDPDEPPNVIDYDTGTYSFKLGNAYVGDTIQSAYKYTSFENYKVWMRNSTTRLPINNGANKEVFGELYVEEHVPQTTTPGQEGSISVVVDPNDDTKAYFVTASDNYPYWSDFVGTIMVACNGYNDDSDVAIGYVESYDATSHTFTLKYPSEISHTGNVKFIKYWLKFWTYTTGWKEMDYIFPTETNVDILFVEASSLFYEEANNMYNYHNFFKVVDIPAPVLELKQEEQMTGPGNATDASMPSPWSGKIFSGLPMTLSGGYDVDFIEFQVNNLYYVTDSLEVYVDGVKVFHYASTDDPSERRCIEMSPATGIFRIINMNLTQFETEEVYVNYVK